MNFNDSTIVITDEIAQQADMKTIFRVYLAKKLSLKKVQWKSDLFGVFVDDKTCSVDMVIKGEMTKSMYTLMRYVSQVEGYDEWIVIKYEPYKSGNIWDKMRDGNFDKDEFINLAIQLRCENEPPIQRTVGYLNITLPNQHIDLYRQMFDQ